MKKIKKDILILFAMTIVAIALSLPSSYATLQADGSTGTAYNLDTWISSVRDMEAIGGTLGLSETKDSTTQKPTNDNGLDIHMQRNTEYGAVAILSASGYGNPNKINDGETTTGNKSGIYMYLNREWVAAGQVTGTSIYKNANARYKDNYTRDYIQKNGDAITETLNWHGSSVSNWISDRYGMADIISGLLRSCSGSIFSYDGYSTADGWLNYKNGIKGNAGFPKTWCSRAVIVVGNGL